MRDLTIRPYAAENAEAADAVLRAAFRTAASFVPHLTRCARIEPDGFFVGVRGPRVVATGGAILYGDVAVVALMSVDPDMGRVGIGAAILAHVEAYAASHGVTTFVLDATDEGRGLYARHGYARVGTSAERVLASPLPSRSGTGADRPRKVTSLDDVIDYDAEIFGARRHRVLSTYAETCPVLVERDDASRIVGYAFVQPAIIGPLVGDTPEVVERLVVRALEQPFAARPRVLCADEGAPIALRLEALGLTRARTLTRMRKGPRADVGADTRLVGKASFATG